MNDSAATPVPQQLGLYQPISKIKSDNICLNDMDDNKLIYHFVEYVKKYDKNCNENQMIDTNNISQIVDIIFDVDSIYVESCLELNSQTKNCITDCINFKNIVRILIQQQDP